VKRSERLVISITEVKEEGLKVKGDLPAKVLDLPVDEAERQTCPNPLQYDLAVHLVGDGMLVEGAVRTTARCRCDRCLAYFDLAIADEALCHFYEHLTVTEVDVTDDLREDLLITLPTVNLCQEACRGICPQCGQNLNTRPCECPATPGKAFIWHQLDDLHL